MPTRNTPPMRIFSVVASRSADNCLVAILLVIGAVIFGLSSSVSAAGDPASRRSDTPDPAHGQRLFQTCRDCHAVEGYRHAYPNYNMFPVIAGQHQSYLLHALDAYRSRGPQQRDHGQSGQRDERLAARGPGRLF